MVTTAPPPEARGGEQKLILAGPSWVDYERFAAAANERSGLRLIYLDGVLVFLTKSRQHEWYAARGDHLLWAGATEAGIACEDAGETAFRRDLGGGGMGDRTYYFGGHATQMHGPKDIDLAVDPPPDLAVEVEVTHSPTEALAVYQRLGVPEIWHVIAREDLWTVRIWRRQAAGSYELVERSSFLPLSADDLLEPAPPGPLERRRPLGRASADLGPRGLVDSAAALRNGRR